MNEARWGTVRNALFVVALLGLVPAASAFVQSGGGAAPATPEAGSLAEAEGDLTVVASQSGPDSGGIYVYDERGDLVHRLSGWDEYFDVDPVERNSLLYLRAREGTCDGEPCGTTQLVVANLTTGTKRVVWSETNPTDEAWKIHDADRVAPGEYLIADIVDDRVYRVNVTTGRVEWSWSMGERFVISEGGPPGDWSHMNDVEKLSNGWVMASPRNFDQVLFLDPGHGLRENWTLGADGNYSVLYEQHNPDYIPAERGGPAVLVADSQNNRIVEYQRADGEWERSWVWRDGETAWPRDADRLPNGNTLIADSNANRVVEVDTDGEVVWRVDVPNPYEVERLGTGDESAGGRSATALGLQSVRNRFGTGPSAGVKGTLLSVLPNKLLNALLFVTPEFLGVWSVLSGLVSFLLLVSVLLGELYVGYLTDASLPSVR